MNRDRNTPTGFRVQENNVATPLTIKDETGPLKSPHNFTARDSGQPHKAAGSTW